MEDFLRGISWSVTQRFSEGILGKISPGIPAESLQGFLEEILEQAREAFLGKPLVELLDEFLGNSLKNRLDQSLKKYQGNSWNDTRGSF